MNPRDPNTTVLELVAHALGPLRDELVLVGGCSVGLLITDQARPPVRQTVDVDLVAEVSSVADYYASLVPKLQGRGFFPSPEEENFCRWRKGSLIVDVMPTEQGIFGHSTNRWYVDVAREARRLTLPSGVEINVVSAPYFIATKLEAFQSRGKGDYLHHDMEDIINVVDGRVELADEVRNASEEVRTYIREEFDALLAEATFVDQLGVYFQPDVASQSRVPIVLSRMIAMAGL